MHVEVLVIVNFLAPNIWHYVKYEKSFHYLDQIVPALNLYEEAIVIYNIPVQIVIQQYQEVFPLYHGFRSCRQRDHLKKKVSYFSRSYTKQYKYFIPYVKYIAFP